MLKKVITFIVITIMLFSLFTPFKIFADVVVGDNNDIVINSNTQHLSRKLAMLESFSMLLESGVSSFSLTNMDNMSVDDYLDSLYNDIEDSISNYNPDVSDIVNSVANWDNLNKIHTWINDRANELSFKIPNGATLSDNLLATFFNNTLFKEKKSDVSSSIIQAGLDSLSAFNNSISVNPDTNYITYIEVMNGTGFNRYRNEYNYYYNRNSTRNLINNVENYTLIYPSNSNNTNNFYNLFPNNYNTLFSSIINIYISRVSDDTYQYSFTTDYKKACTNYNNSSYNYYGGPTWDIGNNLGVYVNGTATNQSNTTYSKSGTLQYLFSNLASFVKNANIYVDGIPWSLVSVPNYPTLNIDGKLIEQNSNDPIGYNIPNDTYIDYNKLYDVIYQAIQDSLPVSMQTMNDNSVYYDSHNNIYSPTIYNYYNNNENDSEQDYIDTLISSATVPNFNQTYLIPLTDPLDSGFKALYVGVSWIPEEELIIFGGLFVLLLFVAILNRMLE